MSTPPLTASLGPPSSPWLYTSTTGFDLSRPPPSPSPSHKPLSLNTTTSRLTIAPSKSALLIIDMQNFFLSPSLGRDTNSTGLKAAERIKNLVPVMRQKGVRVVWVNWGLTGEEVQSMPAGVGRAFGFEARGGSGSAGVGVDKHGEVGGTGGFGSALGRVCLAEEEGGGEVDAGPLLVRESWNADLYFSLRAVYDAGAALEVRPDVWVHKNRMSGLWGARTALEEFLEKEGITTLFFAGVNTDQCVGGTLTDAFSKGFDCVLLSDGSATSSPRCAQEAWEWNAANTFGFCCRCEDLAGAIEKGMEGS